MMCGETMMSHDIWPSGLRVLVVESDPLSLLLIQHLLQQCNYKVTSCRLAAEAISLAVEDRQRFDIAISDVLLPNEEGFLVLKVLALQLDIPVVMMSWNGETNIVMKYIVHGACDFLIKPLRLKELKNIWQHVLRKARREQSMDGLKGTTVTSSTDGLKSSGSKAVESSRKRSGPSSLSMEVAEEVISDVRGLKKARLHWTKQLHHQFVCAVNALGIEKTVPKKILETMKVEQLTREHVASHLQKYRSYLKKLSSSLPQHCDKSSAHQVSLALGTKQKIDDATLKSLQQFVAMEKRNAAYQAEISKSLKSKSESGPSALTQQNNGIAVEDDFFDELIGQFGKGSPQQASAVTGIHVESPTDGSAFL
ncbi:two-component response regulator ARR1-like [Magnolia sinica]|uniref:two-component response regulator ARR1-like n=1 Tax=Magnolia sinica TaxID=86752 RepID=UPI00265ACC64|nr:two-component response regulator ARR1-like [Magnolia sinica]